MTARLTPGRTTIDYRARAAAYACRIEAGEGIAAIALAEGVTPNRIYQILNQGGVWLNRAKAGRRVVPARVVITGRPAWSRPGPELLAVVHAARDEMRWALGFPERSDV